MATRIVDLIFQHAFSCPGRIAITRASKNITYWALRNAVIAVAQELVSRGVGPGDRVPVLTTRCAEGIVSIIGVLAAGACYVPVDAENWNKSKIESTIQRLRPKVLVSTIGTSTSKIPILRWTDSFWNELGDHTIVSPSFTGSNDLAYIIFTSGTTGTPKGVMISAVSLLHYVHQVPFNLAVSVDDIVLLTLSIAFDACTCIIFSTLCNGGALLLSSPSTLTIDAARCSILPLSPSLLRALHDPNDYERVHSVFLGGETPDSELIHRWSSRRRRLYNSYGATETTCTSLIAELSIGRPVTLGKPIRGSAVYVLGDDLTEHAEGELCISGKGLAQGYFEDSARTSQAFFEHKGVRTYRTGDYVKRTVDGLIYVGRRDNLAKNRGFLINIDSQVLPALRSHSDVEDAAAMIYSDRLIGFVTGARAQSTTIRSWLSSRFDTFLVPDQIHNLDQLPLTPNGKVDTRHLQDLLRSNPQHSDFHNHISPYEIFCHAVGEVLGLQQTQLRLDSSFWDLGGNSMLAIRVLSCLHRRGFTLPIIDLLSPISMRRIIDRIQLLPFALTSECRPPAAVPASIEQLSMVRSSIQNPPLGYIVVKIEFTHSEHDSGDGEHIKHAFQQVWKRHSILASTVDTSLGTLTFEKLSLNWKHTLVLEQDRYGQAIDSAIETACAKIKSVAHPTEMKAQTPLHLITFANQASTVVWALHHAFVDGWAMSIIMEEFGAILNARRLEDAPSYHTYLQALNRHMQKTHSLRLDFWCRMLQDRQNPVPLSLYGSQPPEIAPIRYIEAVPLCMSHARLEARSRVLRVSSAAVIYAAWSLVLSVYNNADYVVFGAVLSGRNLPMAAVDRVVGPLMNTCPFPVDFRWDTDASTFLRNIHDQHIAIAEHQWGVADAVNVIVRGSAATLFDTVVAIEYDLSAASPAHKVGLRNCSIARQDYPEFKLTLFIELNADEQLMLRAVFDPCALDVVHVRRLLDHFRNLLEACLDLKAEALSLRDLRKSMLRKHELEQLLNVRAPALPLPGAVSTAVDLLKLARDQYQSLPALESYDGTVTYQELFEMSNRVARELSHRIKPADVVAVLSDGSTKWVTAMLGVLLAGAVYAPIDVNLPTARKEYLMTASMAALCIIPNYTATKDFSASNLPLVPFDDLLNWISSGSATIATNVVKENPAYLIFTSGTTGRSKPVQLSHGSLLNYLANPAASLFAKPGRRHAQMYSVGFDVSIGEVIGVLCHGATLVLKDPRDPYAHLQNVHAAMFTPSFLSAWCPSDFPCMDTILLAGETVPQALADRWSGRVDLYNGYGPCECTIISTIKYLRPGEMVTIGSPVPGMAVKLLDHHGWPVPIGVVGEICLSGAQIAQGYVGHQNASGSFKPDPFYPDEDMYCTGDLGAWTEDLGVCFLGRKDNQVKVRGFRVELQEVEAHILAVAPAAHQAAVALQVDGQSLMAAVCPASIDTEQVKKSLRTLLAPQSVPTIIVALDKMPLTPNQKLDREKLRMIVQEKTVPSANPPCYDLQTNTERVVADAWQHVLGLPESFSLGKEDQFHALGGHSIHQLRLAQQLSQRVGVKIPLRLILEHQRLADQAAAIVPISRPQPTRFSNADVLELASNSVSLLEEELYNMQQSSSHPAAFNVGVQVSFECSTDAYILETAINFVLAQYDVFRSQYHSTTLNGSVERRLHDTSPRVQRIKSPTCKASNHAQDMNFAFDLSKDLLIQASLICNTQALVLVLKMHHIITDADSIRIVVESIWQAYTKLDTSLEAGALSKNLRNYTHWAAWSRQHPMTATSSQRSFWLRWLSDAPPSPFSPAADLSTVGELGAHTQFTILTDSNRGRLVSQEHIIAAVSLGVYETTGALDFFIGVSHMDRSEPGTQDLVGCFVDRLPVRISLLEKTTGSEETLVLYVRQQLNQALAHMLPFSVLRDTVPDSARVALDIVVTFHRYSSIEVTSHSPLIVRQKMMRSRTAALFTLLVEVQETGEGLDFTMVYKPHLITTQQISVLEHSITNFFTMN